ncbi:MAG: hypothetical protein QNJ32_20600 [Xenococcaceae cyanobacterium MO_167.B27]|nr:hypothetical protein [Xenococcaceae cyanobacterium MO_167.B27]
MTRAIDRSWYKIFQDYNIYNHDFNNHTFYITAKQIKVACQNFTETGEKEPRILCKQDPREKRPQVFIDNNLFLLPVRNGQYAIIKEEGYIDIPKIDKSATIYNSQLDFTLDISLVGNSEMQHLDFAYASSLIRTFMDDNTLVLTIRGRKYTPEFSFYVGKQKITAKSVQTEVDAGYEGKKQVVLVEAKNQNTENIIIRQLFYPFKQWQLHTNQKVVTRFFEKNNDLYFLWQFNFEDADNYNSIKLVKNGCYKIN